MNGLDPQSTVEMHNLILKLNEEEKITILISSHILDELAKVATCYGIINKGILIEEINAKQLIEKCGSHIELKIDTIDKAITILNTHLNITNYKFESGGVIKTYAQTHKTSYINSCMAQNQVAVDSIIEKKMSLEDYFLSLDKGGIKNV